MLEHYRKRIAELSAKLGVENEDGQQSDLQREALAGEKKHKLEIQVTSDEKTAVDPTKETPRFNEAVGPEADFNKEDATSQQTKADSKKEAQQSISAALEEKEKEIQELQSILEDVRQQVDKSIRQTEGERLSFVKDHKIESQQAIDVKRQLSEEIAARQKAVDEKVELEKMSIQLTERCTQLTEEKKELEGRIADLTSTVDRLSSAKPPALDASAIKPSSESRALEGDRHLPGAPTIGDSEPVGTRDGRIEPVQQPIDANKQLAEAHEKDQPASPRERLHERADAADGTYQNTDNPLDSSTANRATDDEHRSPSQQIRIASPVDVEVLLRELEQVRVLLEDADKSLSAKQKEIDELQRRNHELHQQTLKTHELLDDSEREINLLSRSIKQKDKQLPDQELKSMKSQLKSSQTELEYYKQRVEELSGLENAHTRLLDANSTVANLTIKLREASFEISNLSASNRELRDRASELETDLIEKDLLLVQARDEATRAVAWEADLGNLQEENHQLQSALRNVKGQLSIETDQTGKLLKKIESTEEELRQRKQECDQLRRDISEIRSRADELNNEVFPRDEPSLEFKPLSDCSQASPDSYEHLRTAYHRDASQLKKLTDHNRKLCEAYIAQKSELQSLQDTINKLMIDYHTVCQEFSRVKPNFSSSMPSLFKPLPLEPPTVDSQ